jgi:hypothetical protein
MKTSVSKKEQYLTDTNGKRTGVVLDLAVYQHLREAEEELADIQAYDSTREYAQAEIAAGQFSTLAAYRAGRVRKSK